MKNHNDLLKHARRRANWELRIDRIGALLDRIQGKKRANDRRRTARELETRGAL